ncbi:hypothetical protein GCM10023322_80150 [Rugosimonospora acidiphila]|uniref:L,D-TPase catalytic domain-containing protein n=1 Tax=Rugosimonospora acidiphila TaxID=556531 RepID=A0ABP9SQV1_9ACTN
MRTPLRWAVAGTIALALTGGLGLTACANPNGSSTVNGGMAPAAVWVDRSLAASPSPSTSPSASPSPSPSPSATPTSRKPTPTPTHAPTTKAATPTTTSNLASRLHTIPSSTTQLLVVYTNGYGTDVATAETFQKVNGVWQPEFGKMSARIGTKGFSDNHQENIPTTPTGVYGFGSTMYGVDSNPGVRYGYHKLVADDYWDENPSSSTYNSFVHGSDPGGASESLWETVPQYNYFAVINYNIPVVSATPARGSGIFLHVMGSGGTAGCVSLAQSNLLKVLKWLNPADHPRIVMAPSQNLSRY